MKKDVIIIRSHNGEPLLVVGVTKVDSSNLVALQKEAKNNLIAYFAEQKATLDDLQDQINNLKKEVKFLKGEDESL